MSFKDKLGKILEKHVQLQDKLSDPEVINSKDFIKLSKELSDLESIVENVNSYKKMADEYDSLKLLVEDNSTDNELKDMAEQELYNLKKLLPEEERKLK